MAKVIALEPTVEETAELQAEISRYLAEMQQLNKLMAHDQQRIDTLKAETQVIAAETRTLMEGLQGTLQELSAV